MKRIFTPTRSIEDWKTLLAQPDLHWKPWGSAMALAKSWEAAGAGGFPPEVRTILDSTDCVGLKQLKLLVAFPEYQVDLPGGDTSSQTDVLVLAKGCDGLVTIAVEGKVDEPFGPTVGEKRAAPSDGVDERIRFLHERLGLSQPVPDAIRYQLLHRTVSALLTAEHFGARLAVMLIHSFSPTDKWFDDFSAFAALFGRGATIGELLEVGDREGIRLFLGWCKGDPKHWQAKAR